MVGKNKFQFYKFCDNKLLKKISRNHNLQKATSSCPAGVETLVSQEAVLNVMPFLFGAHLMKAYIFIAFFTCRGD